MAYTVKELADLAGVSVRTLHFYDEIGLLVPARKTEKGYRLYEKEQLLRLQQILVYRELGMPLAEIQRILRGDEFDVLTALEAHRITLEKSMREKERLLETIEKTIAHFKGGKDMTDKEMFEGFDPKKQEEYEREIIERYGPEVVAESKRRTKGWSEADFEKVQMEFDEVHRALTEALKAGLDHDSDQVTSIIRRHYLIVSRFYTPTKEMYTGLGQLYLDHPDFRKLYDAYHPDLASFLAEAMRSFAEREMAC